MLDAQSFYSEVLERFRQSDAKNLHFGCGIAATSGRNKKEQEATPTTFAEILRSSYPIFAEARCRDFRNCDIRVVNQDCVRLLGDFTSEIGCYTGWLAGSKSAVRWVTSSRC